MARYKPYDAGQVKLIPVSFADQIFPGTFAYALNERVDQLQQTGRHSGAGVWESKEQGTEPVHAPRQEEMNTQWQLFSLVHNIEKIAQVGAA